MKRYTIKQLQDQIAELQALLEEEIDDDKQLDLEIDIQTLQAEINKRKAKEQEIER